MNFKINSNSKFILNTIQIEGKIKDKLKKIVTEGE